MFCTTHIAHLPQECHNPKILEFLSYWYRKKRLQMHFLTGIVSLSSWLNLSAGEQLCHCCTHIKL